jgi:uncharacterized membrane protein
MQPSSFHFFPLVAPFVLALLFLIGLLMTLIEFGILGYAYEKLGINHRYVFVLLLLSLLGSYVNIPVAELPAEPVLSGQVVTYYGLQYVVPVVEQWPRTILAVNVGGAIIPTLLSAYLLVKHGRYGRSLVGVVIVTLVVHWLAQPVKGVGIAVPVFIPPVVAAITALVLSPRAAPPVAYISGSLGTLIGADLLNVGKIPGLGAPIASIGGAGTFDGVFLTGIMAVLLVSIIPSRGANALAGAAQESAKGSDVPRNSTTDERVV